jgi:putative sugar O-methyltransferase
MVYKKIKKIILEKRLFKTIIKELYPYFLGFYIFFFKRKNKNIKIYTSKLIKPNKNDLELGDRIFKSFKLMKENQKNSNDIFKPSSLWQSHIDNDFDVMSNSLKTNDVEKFCFFLVNFGNWEKYLGIEDQNKVRKYNSNIILRSFLENHIFEKQLKIWKFFLNDDNHISELNLPKFGNQIGAEIDGNFLVEGSFFSHFYANLLNIFIKNINRPIIADLGAGYGKLAYYILKNKKEFCFIDFDLPETLCLASFYLIKTWPGKKSFLYGESNFSNEITSKYDLIFLPNFEIEKIQKNTIDLFINKNSLGEMKPETSKKFIKNICNISKIFFHMNHETFRNKFENGSSSLINDEYPITSDFELIFRRPDFGHIINQNSYLDFDSDIFVYLYKQK